MTFLGFAFSLSETLVFPVASPYLEFNNCSERGWQVVAHQQYFQYKLESVFKACHLLCCSVVTDTERIRTSTLRMIVPGEPTWKLHTLLTKTRT